MHWSNPEHPKHFEVKKRLSESAKKRTGNKHPMFGRKHSDETKLKQSKAKENYTPWNKGVSGYFSDQARKNISAGRKGKPAWNSGIKNCHSQETLQKISENSKLLIHSEETKRKVSKKIIDFCKNPIVRKHRSDVAKGIPKSEDFKRKMSIRMRTEANPWYVDGRCSGENQPYPEDFNEKLRELIRDRDGHKCRICSLSEEENGKKLDVHHVDYNKENCNPDNLRSLCHSCHMKTNSNRSKWISFFGGEERIKLNRRRKVA